MSLFHKKPKHEVTDVRKRFDLISRIGQGSMSRVWRADDPIGGRFVAVKVLDKEKTARFEARFKGLNKPSEGDIALSLHHPNIVQTYEVGFTPDEEMFLVMEYVDGCGLSLLVDLQSDRMTRYRTRYMIQIGEALQYFHDQNWIHRDICPRNIMVTEDNNIKLIDFGLTVPNTPEFRKPGNRTGTANYMAPELIKRQPTDQRIDIFSYAVTCFEMYTKRHPWDAAMTIDAVLQHINKPPLQITDLVPRIDSQIADTIMKGLEANPADRWQTVSEMVKQFREAERRLVKQTRELLKRRKLIKQKKAAVAKKAAEKAAAAKETVAAPQAADDDKPGISAPAPRKSVMADPNNLFPEKTPDAVAAKPVAPASTMADPPETNQATAADETRVPDDMQPASESTDADALVANLETSPKATESQKSADDDADIDAPLPDLSTGESEDAHAMPLFEDSEPALAFSDDDDSTDEDADADGEDDDDEILALD